MTGDLNAKQLAFVRAFMECHEATSAAKTAGYSAKSAQVIGCQLLKHPKVAAEIARRRLPIEKKSALTAEKVVDRLNNLVDFDVAQLYDESGKLLPINKMPLEARRAIASIDGDKIRFTSALGSLELAAKLLGMVKEQQTQQQAIQITIAAPAAIPEVSVDVKRLVPEWDT